MGTRTFFENTCKNCSGVTIETSPFRISMTASYVKTKKFWTAVPYPSSFHWCEGIKELPWAAPARATTKRHVLVMFIGSIEMATPRSSHLRRRLYKDCSEHSGMLTIRGYKLFLVFYSHTFVHLFCVHQNANGIKQNIHARESKIMRRTKVLRYCPLYFYINNLYFACLRLVIVSRGSPCLIVIWQDAFL
jgi:hypothetical protein